MSRKIISNNDILGGEPYLKGTRIRVSDISAKYEELGYTVEEINQAYERMEREDIGAALMKFYGNS